MAETPERDTPLDPAEQERAEQAKRSAQLGSAVGKQLGKAASGGVGKAAGGASAAGASAASSAGSAATSAAAASGGTAAALGASSTAGVVGSVAGDVAELASSAREGDAVGAGDALVRGAAKGTAAYFGGTAGAAAASVLLDTEVGRATTRGASRLVIGIIAGVIVVVGVVLLSVFMTIGGLLVILGGGEAVASACQPSYNKGAAYGRHMGSLPSASTAPAPAVTPTPATTPAPGETAAPSPAPTTAGCYGSAVNINVGDLDPRFVIPLRGPTKFAGGYAKYPQGDLAISRALSYVGHAEIPCTDGKCVSQCDHLVGYVWGHAASGYETAAGDGPGSHWLAAVSEGIAHPGDYNPPIGSLVFFDTANPANHVATYMGNGMIVSNYSGPSGYNVYYMPADYFGTYIGWADPVFRTAIMEGSGFVA